MKLITTIVKNSWIKKLDTKWQQNLTMRGVRCWKREHFRFRRRQKTSTKREDWSQSEPLEPVRTNRFCREPVRLCKRTTSRSKRLSFASWPCRRPSGRASFGKVAEPGVCPGRSWQRRLPFGRDIGANVFAESRFPPSAEKLNHFKRWIKLIKYFVRFH